MTAPENTSAPADVRKLAEEAANAEKAVLVEAGKLLNPDSKSGPPQPLMHPNAEWCEAYERWFHRAVRYTIARNALSPRDATPALAPCHCTTVQQDETCPVGYPSLLCDDCDGKGVVPAAGETTPARPEADDERVRREAMEDERDRLYEKARRHAAGRMRYAKDAAAWLRAETDAVLPADRALLRKGGA